MTAIAVIFHFSFLSASSPSQFTYQGKLTDAQGNPMNGDVPMVFELFAVESGGSALCTDDRSAGVPVANGVFEVAIGSVGCMGIQTYFQGGADRWLEITANGKTLTPRQRLTASPYALAVASGISVDNLAAGTFPAGDYSIDSTGRLGVGKAPGYPLDVAGDININAGSTLRIGGDPAVFSNWTVNGSSISRDGNVGISTGNPQYKLDVNGDINLTGQLRQSGTPAVFSNWGVTGSNIYRMSNVGIGTTNPGYKLDVRGDVSVNSNAVGTAVASVFTGGNTGKSYLHFPAITGSNDPGFIMHETSAQTGDVNKGVIHISPTDDNDNINDYVAIHGTDDSETLKLYTGGNIYTTGVIQIAGAGNNFFSGNVGISTGAPQAKLDVNGTANISGALTAGGVATQGYGIVDTVSNTNGTCIKYGEGTMMCYHNASFTPAANWNYNTTYPDVYWSTNQFQWDFPAAFVSNPVVQLTAQHTTSSYVVYFIGGANASAISTTYYRTPLGSGAAVATPVQISCFAIGRWQ